MVRTWVAEYIALFYVVCCPALLAVWALRCVALRIALRRNSFAVFTAMMRPCVQAVPSDTRRSSIPIQSRPRIPDGSFWRWAMFKPISDPSFEFFPFADSDFSCYKYLCFGGDHIAISGCRLSFKLLSGTLRLQLQKVSLPSPLSRHI